MTNFEINGKEYELKLTFPSIKYLNGLYNGGSYELLGKVMMGDLETFIKIVYAGLLHTCENFKLKDVENVVSELIEQGKLSQNTITKILNEVVVNHPFYKDTVDKLLQDNKQAKEAMEQILK